MTHVRGTFVLQPRTPHWAEQLALADAIRASNSRSGRNLHVEADAIGEQQLKRTQSGSSIRSGRNLGAEADRGKRLSAAEADAMEREQQLKRIDAALHRELSHVGERGEVAEQSY